MRRFQLVFMVLLVAGGLAVAAGDAVASLAPATIDCQAHPNGLTGHYTISELREALATMPAEVTEYTNCVHVITDQLNKQLASLKVTPPPAAGTSTGGSFISTPVLIVVIVIVLAGAGFALSARKRGGGGGGTQPPAAGSS
jgi:hypothetical protein